MPIRPENKTRYPADWPAISRRIRERADNRCEWCGVENGALGGRTPDGTFCKALPIGGSACGCLVWPKPGEWWPCEGWGHPLRIIRIVLTVAHLDHMPENCDDENLAALCQRCHNRYDAAHRRRGTAQRRRAQLACGDLFTGTTSAAGP